MSPHCVMLGQQTRTFHLLVQQQQRQQHHYAVPLFLLLVMLAAARPTLASWSLQTNLSAASKWSQDVCWGHQRKPSLPFPFYLSVFPSFQHDKHAPPASSPRLWPPVRLTEASHPLSKVAQLSPSLSVCLSVYFSYEELSKCSKRLPHFIIFPSPTLVAYVASSSLTCSSLPTRDLLASKRDRGQTKLLPLISTTSRLARQLHNKSPRLPI